MDAIESAPLVGLLSAVLLYTVAVTSLDVRLVRSRASGQD
jgi:hypothetical protein